MSLKRHVLQVVAIVTAVALVFGALAGTASAAKLTKKQKAQVRKQLRKQVKKNPGAVKRKSFLKRAALVNFKLPVTIRLRNPCSNENGANPANPFAGPPTGQLLTNQNCATQGTALNQRTIPTANVNLGPSLGTRSVAIGGALAAVVEFQDTYDGGALGNVNLKILPGNKTLSTSSVPLLWNNDITDPTTRADANFAKSVARAGGALAPLESYVDANFKQGCGDFLTTVGGAPTYAAGQLGAPPSYKALFYNLPANLGFGTFNGLPGYTVYDNAGNPAGVSLPVFPDGDPTNIQAGGVIGNNNWIGTNPNPFPTGSAPVSSGGSPTLGGLYPTSGGTPLTIYNAQNTVLRTNALSLGIAPGGVSVNMSTGTATTPGGLTTAQGSQDITLGYSGGQANLFGNIPGKNVGIDVTVNLATRINSIVRIMDQDVFKQPSLITGEPYPAGIFNCRQIFTGAVQNYIPGVRLTGSLRIAPAITKDGKVRIAKATVSSDVNNPDRVALSACLFPAKSYNAYTPGNTDNASAPIPTYGGVTGGGTLGTEYFHTAGGVPVLAGDGNTGLPISSAERYPGFSGSNAPSTVPCGSDKGAQVGEPDDLADIIRQSGLTGTVAGLPGVTDPAYGGIQYRGDQASVAGDITVNPLDVDVLLGDQLTGT